MEAPRERSEWVADKVLPLESSLRLYVRRYLRAQTDDAANDLLQELYARLLRAKLQWSAIENPLGYCQWVLKNIHVDRIRHSKVVSIQGLPDVVDVQADDAPGPEQTASAWEEYSLFTQTLAQLEPIEREGFVLHRFEGWKVRDIAVHLGVKTKRMEKTLATAQAKLVRLLAAAGVEAPRRAARRDRESRETSGK